MAARATITPSAPVSASIFCASAREKTPPLATTGMETAPFAAAICA